jgi:archaellum biogenesis ATPase FlaH
MRYSPISVDQLMGMEFPELEYVIDGFLVAGSATLLTGREKSGKGLLALDLAASVCLGETFMGRAVLTEGPVIYCALEENARTVRSRLAARLGGRTEVPLYLVRLDGSTEERFELENIEHVLALQELIETLKPVVVIIDTLREAHSGREDVSDDMAPRLRPIRQLAHALDTCIVVTHHASKMSGAFRGSTAIRASFDDELVFTRNDDSQDDGIRGTLKVEGRNLPKNVVKIEFDPASARWIETEGFADPAEPGIRDRIVSVLDNSRDSLTARDIAYLIPGVKLKTIQNQIPTLLQDGAIVASEGPARKGSPRRFRLPQPSLPIPPDPDEMIPIYSGNDGGNNKPRLIADRVSANHARSY